MYDFETSDTDYSLEYSDVEYNTLDPYDYELNSFKNEAKEESTEEKLFGFINANDLEGIKNTLPTLLELQDEVKLCNGINNLCERGDGASDEEVSDVEEASDDDEEEACEQKIIVKKKEVLFKTGDTPLMVASASARLDIVEYILSLGVDVNFHVTNTNNCALLALVSNISVGWRYMNNLWRLNAPKVLKMLIDAGANVKIKGFLSTQESGYTALHYAAQSNYWEMIELLIHAGADVDVMCNQKETALMLASSKGYVACCNILLLAGANAELTDRSGSNAAYLAGVEGHKILSDAISVYSGSAQHHVDLYKIWSQYVQRGNGPDPINRNSSDIVDNISNTCIESFCLAIDAPYLVAIMQDQGVTISDLKLMGVSKLKEIGVSEEDCEKILMAMQDFHRKTNSKSSKISFEYGRPLKMVTMLEMVGNMSEHVELIDTNLESWYAHLSKKYQTDMVLHKSTINRLRTASQTCLSRATSFLDQLQELKNICEQKNGTAPQLKLANGDRGPHSGSKNPGSPRWVSFKTLSLVGASLVAVSLTVAFMARRIR